MNRPNFGPGIAHIAILLAVTACSSASPPGLFTLSDYLETGRSAMERFLAGGGGELAPAVARARSVCVPVFSDEGGVYTGVLSLAARVVLVSAACGGSGEVVLLSGESRRVGPLEKAPELDVRESILVRVLAMKGETLGPTGVLSSSKKAGTRVIVVDFPRGHGVTIESVVVKTESGFGEGTLGLVAIAETGSDPESGEWVAGYVPLSSVAGAPVFDEQGAFIGLVRASEGNHVRLSLLPGMGRVFHAPSGPDRAKSVPVPSVLREEGS